MSNLVLPDFLEGYKRGVFAEKENFAATGEAWELSCSHLWHELHHPSSLNHNFGKQLLHMHSALTIGRGEGFLYINMYFIVDLTTLYGWFFILASFCSFLRCSNNLMASWWNVTVYLWFILGGYTAHFLHCKLTFHQSKSGANILHTVLLHSKSFESR